MSSKTKCWLWMLLVILSETCSAAIFFAQKSNKKCTFQK